MTGAAPTGRGRGMLDDILRSYLAASRKAVIAVSIAFLALMVAINGFEIAGRAFLDRSFVWVQEISIISAMWVYFFAYGLVAKDGEYIRVDLFASFLGPRARRAMDMFARLVTIGFHAVVAWFAVETFQFLGLFRTSVLDWPESLFVLPLLAGACDILVTECIHLRWALAGHEPAARPPAAEED